METLRVVLLSKTIPHVTRNLDVHLSEISHTCATSIIRAGEELYRTGRVIRSKTIRKTTRKTAKATAATKSTFGKVSFFSSWQVAATYAQDGLALNTYAATRDLTLLQITDVSMRFLFDVFVMLRTRGTTASHFNDSVILRNFLTVFGYRLDKVFELLHPGERLASDFRTHYRTWAKTLFEHDADHINVLEAYPETGKDEFNRISVTSEDYNVFTALFEIETLREFMNTFDGIHAPPLHAGFLNKENFLSSDELFPEEVFLRTGVIFKHSHPYYHGHETSAISYCANSATPGFYNVKSDAAIMRIYLFTRTYSMVHSTIMEALHRIYDATLESSGDDMYHAAALKFIQTAVSNTVMSSVLWEAGKVLAGLLEIDEHLLTRIPSENPFYDTDGKLKTNLYTYTVLSTTIKELVRGLAIISNEENFNTGLSPLISGGALFGIYTWGEFRRQTKDVDVKLITNGPDDPANGDEIALVESTMVFAGSKRFRELETAQWYSTMTNYLWLSIAELLLNRCVNSRLHVFASKFGMKAREVKATWDVYVSATPNMRKFKNLLAECDLYFSKRFTRNLHQMTEWFDAWLAKTQPVISSVGKLDSLATYTNQLRVKLPWKTFDRMIKLFTNDFVSTLPADVKTAYSRFSKFYVRLNEIINNRPSILLTNGTQLGMGWFSSLYIRTDDHGFGLIDLTYDTQFSTFGSFTAYAGIRDFGVATVNGVQYGSSLWLIYESIKLNEICNGMQSNMHTCAGGNPIRFDEKKRKYEERYDKIMRFFRMYLSKIDQSGFDYSSATLENIYERLRNGLNGDTRIMFDDRLVKAAKSTTEYMVGAKRRLRGRMLTT